MPDRRKPRRRAERDHLLGPRRSAWYDEAGPELEPAARDRIGGDETGRCLSAFHNRWSEAVRSGTHDRKAAGSTPITLTDLPPAEIWAPIEGDHVAPPRRFLGQPGDVRGGSAPWARRSAGPA